MLFQRFGLFPATRKNVRLKLRGQTAVVTGAASGIGRAIAVSLARRGCNLALADIDDESLKRTAEKVAVEGVAISSHHLDVSDRAAVAAFPEQVLAEHAGVDLLINNAGVALVGYFDDTTDADFEWLFEINFWGIVRMTRAFLPLLHKSQDPRIVNMSSIFGLMAPPGQTAYAASKFAVRGFSESLRHELAATPIGVTVVYPGGVGTLLIKHARLPKTLSAKEDRELRRFAERTQFTTAENAGEAIVRGVEKRRARIVLGPDAKWAAFVQWLMPVKYWNVLGAGWKKEGNAMQAYQSGNRP